MKGTSQGLADNGPLVEWGAEMWAVIFERGRLSWLSPADDEVAPAKANLSP